MPNGDAGAVDVACDTGTLISGGVSLGATTVNAFVTEDHPNPDSGTPASWTLAVANTSGGDVTMGTYVVCASPAGSSSSAAAQAQGARIVSKTLTKLPDTAKG